MFTVQREIDGVFISIQSMRSLAFAQEVARKMVENGLAARIMLDGKPLATYRPA